MISIVLRFLDFESELETYTLLEVIKVLTQKFSQVLVCTYLDFFFLEKHLNLWSV